MDNPAGHKTPAFVQGLFKYDILLIDCVLSFEDNQADLYQDAGQSRIK